MPKGKISVENQGSRYQESDERKPAQASFVAQ
jgi:hypothetical protein